jgi:ABC-2 type transport system permease protein
MNRFLHDLWRNRELLQLLVLRNIKIRYKSSVLGFVWTLLNPILFIGIYAMFLGLLKVAIALPLLVSGVIVWSFLDMCLGDSLYAVIGNTNLIKKTSFSRPTLPVAMVLSNLVNFVLSLIILGCYLVFARVSPQHLWLLPVIVLSQTALCLGLGLIVSAMNVYFRDTEHILAVVKLAWFFMTPIIYPISFVFDQVSPTLQKAAFLNPMTGLVTAYRWVLMSEDIIAPQLVTMSHAICWGVLAVGILIFQRAERGFADEL